MGSFIRNIFPVDMITLVNDINVDDFLNGFKDNKVRSLMFAERELPSIRYLTASYAMRQRIQPGFVDTSSKDSVELIRRYNVLKKKEIFMIFGEYSSNPLAKI